MDFRGSTATTEITVLAVSLSAISQIKTMNYGGRTTIRTSKVKSLHDATWRCLTPSRPPESLSRLLPALDRRRRGLLIHATPLRADRSCAQAARLSRSSTTTRPSLSPAERSLRIPQASPTPSSSKPPAARASAWNSPSRHSNVRRSLWAGGRAAAWRHGWNCGRT